MKKLLLILAMALPAADLLAWGAGHDVQVAQTFRRLPPQIRENISDQNQKAMLRWAHYPDGHKKPSSNAEVVKALGESEAKWLDGFIPVQYAFHSTNGKCAAFMMLAKSFREKRYDAATFYMGALMHSIADPSAFNHGPLTHMLTYFRYNNAAFPKCNLDLIVYDNSPEIRKRTEELLEGFKPDMSERKLDDVLAELQIQSWKAAAFMSSIESGLYVPPAAGQNYSKEYVETMAQTANRQIREGVNLVCAAWAIANSGQKIDIGNSEFTKPAKAKVPRPIAERGEKAIAEFVKAKKLSDDSIYAGIADGAGPLPAIGVVAEPSMEMGIAKLGFSSRFLATLCARTLKAEGKSFRLVSLFDIEKGVPNPKDIPILIIPTRAAFPNAKELNKYVESGGKLLIIGGTNAKIANLGGYFAKRPNNETPVSPVYGTANTEEIKDMKIEFDGSLAEVSKKKVAPFAANPNTPAGWGKPVANLEIKILDDKVVPLAWLQYGKHQTKYCVCAAFKNSGGEIFAIWLPQYLIMPMLFTPEKERMPDWSNPQLDSFAKPIFAECVKLLEKRQAKGDSGGKN